MRIGFLFSHYARHQVLHAVPIAFELSRRYPKGLDQNHRLRQTCSRRPAEALRALSERTLRTRACPCASMRRHGRPARQGLQVLNSQRPRLHLQLRLARFKWRILFLRPTRALPMAMVKLFSRVREQIKADTGATEGGLIVRTNATSVSLDNGPADGQAHAHAGL